MVSQTMAVAEPVSQENSCRERNVRPWSVEEDRLLGTAPDTVLALRLGRAIGAVFNRRARLHIPAWRELQAATRGDWTAGDDRLLGTKSDTAVARQLGRRRADVIARRRSLGIPTWRQEDKSNGN